MSPPASKYSMAARPMASVPANPTAPAFPFVRRPLSLDAVRATAIQNAGVGVVVFIPGGFLRGHRVLEGLEGGRRLGRAALGAPGGQTPRQGGGGVPQGGGVGQSVFLDETAPGDVVGHVRSAFASAGARTRVTLGYLEEGVFPRPPFLESSEGPTPSR